MDATVTTTVDGANVEAVAQREGGTQNMQPALGRRLKELRLSRSLSLKDLAGKTGLSASFLSMVETGSSEISVGRLVTMADFYEVGLSDLVPVRSMDPPTVVRRGDRQSFVSPDRRIRREILASWRNGEFTGSLLEIDEGGILANAAPHPGPAFVLVRAGELTVQFSDDTEVVLKEGDSVWFEGSRSHRHLNTGAGELQLITFEPDRNPLGFDPGHRPQDASVAGRDSGTA